MNCDDKEELGDYARTRFFLHRGLSWKSGNKTSVEEMRNAI